MILFSSCKRKEIDKSQAVLSIKETGQLVTAEYTLSKIVKASDDKTWYKIGDRKILMSCEAHLKAGVDVEHLNENDMVIKDKTISLQLPKATVFSLSIPPDKIKVEYADVAWPRDAFSAAEREGLLTQAEVQIRQLADSLGILKTAETNAAAYFQALLHQSGFEQVNVSFK